APRRGRRARRPRSQGRPPTWSRRCRSPGRRGWAGHYADAMVRQRAAARSIATFADLFGVIVENVERVIQGKSDVIHLALLCMVAEGHLLIEDVPGVGKTSLAKALALSLDCTWRRLQ